MTVKSRWECLSGLAAIYHLAMVSVSDQTFDPSQGQQKNIKKHKSTARLLLVIHEAKRNQFWNSKHTFT